MPRHFRVLLGVVPVLVVGAVAACSGGPSPQNVSYNAVVTLDDVETSISLVKLTEDDNGTLTGEVLDTAALGYDGLPFLVGQGRVPEGQANVPPECLGNEPLGIDMATPCVVAPVLELLDAILEKRGLARAEVVLTGVFHTGGHDDYTTMQIQEVATDADTYAASLGYASDIASNEVPLDGGAAP